MVKIPLSLYENFNWMNVNPLVRSTLENRFVFPWPGGNGQYLFLYQLEWINPDPEKNIAAVSFLKDTPLNFQVSLFAVAARQTDKKKNENGSMKLSGKNGETLHRGEFQGDETDAVMELTPVRFPCRLHFEFADGEIFSFRFSS